MMLMYRGTIILIITVLTAIFGGVFVINTEVERSHCTRVGNQAGLDVKYSGGTYFTRDCYVRFNGDWIPYDKWVNITIPGDVR